MRRTAMTISAIAVLCCGGAAAWYWRQNSVENLFIAGCIDTIKDRLRSPSSFQLASVKHFDTVTPTVDDYFGWVDATERKAALASINRDAKRKKLHERQMQTFETGNPKMLRAFIEYEAANSFGAMIKGLGLCTYVFYDDDDPLSMMNVSGPRINGDTKLEWSINALQN